LGLGSLFHPEPIVAKKARSFSLLQGFGRCASISAQSYKGTWFGRGGPGRGQRIPNKEGLPFCGSAMRADWTRIGFSRFMELNMRKINAAQNWIAQFQCLMFGPGFTDL
jgi:hypothetical protein